jgi:hypothetical protein
MLQHTSEQMVVVNLTAEMISDLTHRIGRRVSVIAPTTNEERSLGFDGLFSGLAAGTLLALQFKRPYPHPKAEAKFTIRRDQCYQLDGWGRYMLGLYVLCPFVQVSDFLRAGAKTLTYTAFVDSSYVWNSWTGKARGTRTLTYLKPAGSRAVQITDPWSYDDLESGSWDDLVQRIETRDLPEFSPETRLEPDTRERLFGNFGRTFYFHIARRGRQQTLSQFERRRKRGSETRTIL